MKIKAGLQQHKGIIVYHYCRKQKQNTMVNLMKKLLLTTGLIKVNVVSNDGDKALVLHAVFSNIVSNLP